MTPRECSCKVVSKGKVIHQTYCPKFEEMKREFTKPLPSLPPKIESEEARFELEKKLQGITAIDGTVDPEEAFSIAVWWYRKHAAAHATQVALETINKLDDRLIEIKREHDNNWAVDSGIKGYQSRDNLAEAHAAIDQIRKELAQNDLV